MAEVWIDGAKVATLDLYAQTTSKKAIVWSSPSLPRGDHVLEVRVLGVFAGGASGARVDVDAFVVWP
ncbi:MAG: hypothetical protein QFC55_08245 [Chloroflexota bacterium]|nr:hypothetical protein [Chloroflexota bacterium]